MARVVLSCRVHGIITTPIPNQRSEVEACLRRHRAAGCPAVVNVVAAQRLARSSCSMCGRDEGDDVGVIIERVCGDCRRTWS